MNHGAIRDDEVFIGLVIGHAHFAWAFDGNVALAQAALIIDLKEACLDAFQLVQIGFDARHVGFFSFTKLGWHRGSSGPSGRSQSKGEKKGEEGCFAYDHGQHVGLKMWQRKGVF